ncbi:hypothetical protein BAL199_10320 [alpha proteobacterium BAL199]|nr:hypothetical protein BAL199_10320 [alpha proteobacterium BAL199]
MEEQPTAGIAPGRARSELVSSAGGDGSAPASG